MAHTASGGAGTGGAGSMPAGSHAFPPAQPVFAPGDPEPAVQGDELAQQTGHVKQAFGLLIEQFKKKPKIQSLLRPWLEQVQSAEDALFQLLTLRALDTAFGAQLDQLGAIVGEARQGRNDTTYLIFLKARIALNRSSGTAEEILTIMRAVLTPQGGSAPGMELEDFYPAAFEFRVDNDPLGVDAPSAAKVLSLARAAAVRASFHYIEQAPEDTFQFASGQVSETDANAGFADAGQTIGGSFAGVLQA